MISAADRELPLSFQAQCRRHRAIFAITCRAAAAKRNTEMMMTRLHRNAKGATRAELCLYICLAFGIIGAVGVFHHYSKNALFGNMVTLADANARDVVAEDVSGTFGYMFQPDTRIVLIHHAPSAGSEKAKGARLLCVWEQGEKVRPMGLAVNPPRWRERYSLVEVEKRDPAYVPLADLCNRYAG